MSVEFNGLSKRGFARAKTPRTPSDGRMSVIPSECEGSEKDFSLSVEMTTRPAFARDIPSFGCGFSAQGCLVLDKSSVSKQKEHK